MITINKPLLFNAIDSTLHAINAIVDAAEAIAAIVIDVVEQVYDQIEDRVNARTPITVNTAATENQPDPVVSEDPVIRGHYEVLVSKRSDDECHFVPVVRIGSGRYEVFTSKWSGIFIEAKNLTELTQKIEADTMNLWFCINANVARMRALDAINMSNNDRVRTAHAIEIKR